MEVASRPLDENKQANNARRTAGKLLGHFPSKKSFLFRSKTFPKNDTLTQKRNNVQDNKDVTKQLSLSSIPSVKSARSFWKRFREAFGGLPTFNIFYSFSRLTKKNFRISLP